LANLSTRVYKNWVDVVGGNPPASIGQELVMFDTYNKKYWKVMFSQWTQNNKGGGFAYVRQQIIADNTFGSIIPFVHTNYGNEIDYIDNNVAITRAVNMGIYNPLIEAFYNGNPDRMVHYYMTIPNTLNQTLPHSLDNQVIEECTIIHAQNNPATFYLPFINSMKLSLNPKIIVVNSNVNKLIVTPLGTSRTESGTTINGSTNIGIGGIGGNSKHFRAVASNLWACFTPNLIP